MPYCFLRKGSGFATPRHNSSIRPLQEGTTVVKVVAARIRARTVEKARPFSILARPARHTDEMSSAAKPLRVFEIRDTRPQTIGHHEQDVCLDHAPRSISAGGACLVPKTVTGTVPGRVQPCRTGRKRSKLSFGIAPSGKCRVQAAVLASARIIETQYHWERQIL